MRKASSVIALAALATAEALVGSARAYCIATMTEIYETLKAGEPLSLAQRALYRLAIVHAHRAAVEATNLLFQTAGASAARIPNRLERAFRDVQVANQHHVASGKVYEITGGMLLGVPPAEPLF